MVWVSTTQRCLICEMLGERQETRTESAHLNGTTGAKGSNWYVVPLCAWEHHQHGKFSEHALQGEFWSFWGMDKDTVLCGLWEKFKARKT